MTEENYNYRTSQTLLRNQFPGKGKFKSLLLRQHAAGEIACGVLFHCTARTISVCIHFLPTDQILMSANGTMRSNA